MLMSLLSLNESFRSLGISIAHSHSAVEIVFLSASKGEYLAKSGEGYGGGTCRS